MNKFNWTDEMIAYIVVKRHANQWTWKKIANGFNRRFETKKAESQISLFYRNVISNPVQPYTDEEIDFIHGAFLNNFGEKKTIKAYRELFDKPIDSKKIEWVIKNCNPTNERLQIEKAVQKQKEILQNKIKKNMVNNMKTKTSRKGMPAKRWTQEEHNGLFRITTGKELKEYATKIGRSENSLRQRMSNNKINMTENKKFSLKATKKTKAKKTKPKTKKTYTPRWTAEEDYDLVLNFYELSIDQARNKFNRSYGVIATRLEKLVDSTQPKHEEMLMRAAKEIKARKQAVSKPVKLSRRERRKARKQAKLAKRIAKMKAKIQE
jgi:hypothetical protein